MIYINNSNSSNGAILLNNDIDGAARISAIDKQVIFNTGAAIRFGETAWDWNQWAGLKYNHSKKTIYLGIADGSVFNANSAQSGGKVNLVNCSLYVPSSITSASSVYANHLYSATSITTTASKCIEIAGNTIREYHSEAGGSPYHSNITLNDASLYLSAYGNIDISAGPGTIKLATGGSIELSSYNGFSIIYRGAEFSVAQTNGNEYTWSMDSIKANGNILATGGVTAYSSSDIRLKTDLRKLDYLGIIKAMGGTFGFAWKKDNARSIGWIAQHVLCNPHLKDIVETDENGYYKINYWSPKLIATAFGAIEQVDDEVTRLKKKVKTLENRVKELEIK